MSIKPTTSHSPMTTGILKTQKIRVVPITDVVPIADSERQSMDNKISSCIYCKLALTSAQVYCDARGTMCNICYNPVLPAIREDNPPISLEDQSWLCYVASCCYLCVKAILGCR